MDETPINLVHCALAEHDRTMLTSPDGKRVEVNLSAIAALVNRPPPMLAAAPQSHVAVERRYLEIVVKLAAGRRGAFMGHEASAIAHCRSLLAKE